MQQNYECYTYTGRFPVYRGRISSMIYVSPPENPSSLRLKVRAQWDPGASNTLISKRLFDALDLDFLASSQNLRTAMGYVSKAKESEVWITIVLGGFPIKRKLQHFPSGRHPDVLFLLPLFNPGRLSCMSGKPEHPACPYRG